MADLNLLAEVLELFVEGSPYHVALAEAIADSRRLDKVERLDIDTDIAAPGQPKWVAFDSAGNLTARGKTIRECIDEVPE